MTTPVCVNEVVALLQRRYGRPKQLGRSARLCTFGGSLTCSINYSTLLRGPKYFFGLSKEAADKEFAYPPTELGDFVVLICGSAYKVLFLPRALVLRMLEGVSTCRLDVFLEGGAYILQTTQHPRLNVTEFLNEFPKLQSAIPEMPTESTDAGRPDRAHVKFQSALIDLGRAESCSVWVPPSDKGLSYQGRVFSARTLERLPNFGFEENTRRIVQNIDVLWLSGNVIRKAFEVESSTMIYSGLLRLNDLVLAQPNNQIDLYIVANRAKRQKVYNQLIRPSFHSLIAKCEFFAFEDIEEQTRRLAGIPVDHGARVSGLVRGEKFVLPEYFVYPAER